MLELYSIGVRFLIRKVDGTHVKYDLAQTEFYDTPQEAFECANLLRRQLKQIGQQLIYVTDGPEFNVWTTDPEFYAKTYLTGHEARQPNIHKLPM